MSKSLSVLRPITMTMCVFILAVGTVRAQISKPAQKPTPPASSGGTAKQTPAPGAPLASPALTGKELDAQGEALLQAGKYTEAIDTFSRALKLNAKDIAAQDGLGRAFMGAKKYSDAAKAFQAALDLNPTNPRTFALLSSALEADDKPERARGVLDRAIELNPNIVGLRIQYADTYATEKDYVGAEQAYRHALGYAPDDPGLHLKLADTYEQMGRHTTALMEYDAVANATSQAEYLRAVSLGRSGSLAGLRRFKEAEAIVRIMLVKNAKDADAHSGLAQILEAADKRDEAITEYRAALAITPDNPILWGNLGWTQYGAGKYDDAATSSRKALVFDPKLVYVHFNLGLIFACQNKWKEAQAEYEAGLHDAKAADVQAGLADVEKALGKQPANVALRSAWDLLSRSKRVAGGE